MIPVIGESVDVFQADPNPALKLTGTVLAVSDDGTTASVEITRDGVTGIVDGVLSAAQWRAASLDRRWPAIPYYVTGHRQ